MVTESLEFVRQFTERNWIRKAFNRQDDADSFKELNTRLQVRKLGLTRRALSAFVGDGAEKHRAWAAGGAGGLKAS
jgi:hypothetical protein